MKAVNRNAASHFIKAASLAAGIAAMTSGTVAAQYASMSCGELWYARNSIFAAAGHCFQTARGIAVFGRGCFPPYGQLRRGAQAEVSAIQSWEARKGCR